jgi:hypothetical protein
MLAPKADPHQSTVFMYAWTDRQAMTTLDQARKPMCPQPTPTSPTIHDDVMRIVRIVHGGLVTDRKGRRSSTVLQQFFRFFSLDFLFTLFHHGGGGGSHGSSIRQLHHHPITKFVDFWCSWMFDKSFIGSSRWQMRFFGTLTEG